MSKKGMSRTITLLLFLALLTVNTSLEAKARLLGYAQGVRRFGFGALADPVDKGPLREKTRFYGLVKETFLVPESESDKRKYPVTKAFVDLTIPEEVSKPWWEIENRERVSSRFFQNPFISSIYERGYRQNFESAGFPGIDAEFAEASTFFLTSSEAVDIDATTLVDLSCGSGFMSRKFVKSGQYGQVISADLSPNMLQETRRLFIEEGLTPSLLVRADSAKLPFGTNSIDFLHAGAAMHCWPRLDMALAEVHRVLKPGGKFYASTFFRTFGAPNKAINAMTSRPASSSGMYMLEDECEIQTLLTEAGFNGGSGMVRREGRGCAIVKAVKDD
jgi:SAM-dependent methyltransferase